MKDSEAHPAVEQTTAASPAPVTLLDQTHWKRLTSAQSAADMSSAWAALMFDMLDDAELTGVFLQAPDGGAMRTTATWPDARLPQGSLINAAGDAVASGQGNVRGALPDAASGARPVSIAVPLVVDGKALGAVGAEILPTSQMALRTSMRRLQWGAAWLRDALRRETAGRETARYDHAVQALHAVVAFAEQDSFPTAARAAATDLANRFGCDRVSIGIRRFFGVRIAAISHSAQFGKRMSFTRELAAAQDEAIDQRGVVIHPSDLTDEPLATHRHEVLARNHAIAQMITVPLYAVDRFVGAITFEYKESERVSQAQVEILEAVATVLAPVLDEKRRNDRWLYVKLAAILARYFARLVGPGGLLRKLVVVGLMALVAFFWVAQTEDRVSADAAVEGRIQRMISAPFDGFIAESYARAGDRVSAGDILVRLDDRELALERLRLSTDLQRQQIEYDRALAASDRAQTSIWRAQIEQTGSQIDLVDQRMARTRLTAPFDGLVVAGDLSQDIGASVARGEGLVTIAPGEDYRLALSIDERRIADIEIGQTGQLLATALPETPFAFTITKITPVATYGEGATTFRVEAKLDDEMSRLQPGMAGVAKVDVGEARLIAVWTRPMLDWMRIAAWRWLGWD